MLGWRVFISALLIPLFVAAFVVDHKIGASAPILLAVCLLLAIRCAWELVKLLQTRAFAPSFPLTAACAAGVILAGWIQPDASPSSAVLLNSPLANAMLAFTVAVLLVFLKGACVYESPGRSLETLGAELLIVAYVGVLLAVTAQLRWVAGAQAGYLALGSLIIAVKSGDIGAYTLGRLFGRRKMCPRLSPGKTWMGAVGALIGSVAGTVLWLHFGTPLFDSAWRPCAWPLAVLYGAALGTVGLIGDLCESLIKRDVDQKDSAAILPGFGGLLDLLDSVLYAGPVAYLMWLVLPLATWK